MNFNVIIEDLLGAWGVKIIDVFESKPLDFILYVFFAWLFFSLFAFILKKQNSIYFLILIFAYSIISFSQIWGYKLSLTNEKTVYYFTVPIFIQTIFVGAATAYFTFKFLSEKTYIPISSYVKELLFSFTGSNISKENPENQNLAEDDSGEIFERKKNKRIETFLILIFILLIAAPIRFWKLEEMPRYVHPEYARAGAFAIEVIETGRPYFWKSLTSPMPNYLFFLDGLFALCTDGFALMFLLFGVSFFSMKILPTIFGILSVIAILLFGKRWLGKGVGEASAIFMALCPWMIGLSRDLWSHIILCVLYSIIAFHFLMLSLEKPKYKNICVVLILAALSIYLYRPTFIIIPITGLFFLLSFILKKDWRQKAWKPLLLGTFISILIILPFIKYFYEKNYIEFLGTAAVTHSDEKKPHQFIFENLLSVIQQEIYFSGNLIHRDISFAYWNDGILHMPYIASFFAIGLGAALIGIRKRRIDQLLIFWLIMSFFPCILALGSPARRMIMFEPVFYLLAGRGAIGLLGWFAFICNKTFRIFIPIIVLILIFFMTIVNYGIYIRKSYEYATNTVTEEAEYISKSMDKNYVVSLHSDFGLIDSVNIFSWNKYKTNGVKTRWSFPINNLMEYNLPTMNFKTIEFIIPSPKAFDETLKQAIQIRFDKIQNVYKHWKLRFHYENFRPQNLNFISLICPTEDFPVAKNFIQNTLISYVPDDVYLMKTTQNIPYDIKQGLLQKEGDLPLWTNTAKPAEYISEPIIQFDYPSDQIKPFKSPYWFWWKGYILIPKPGIYIFSLTSDDGSDMWINGSRVIDNMGDHTMKIVENAVDLQPGFYKFELRYYDRIYGAHLHVSVKMPDSSEYIPIPKNWLHCSPQEININWEAK